MYNSTNVRVTISTKIFKCNFGNQYLKTFFFKLQYFCGGWAQPAQRTRCLRCSGRELRTSAGRSLPHRYDRADLRGAVQQNGTFSGALRSAKGQPHPPPPPALAEYFLKKYHFCFQAREPI